jgi:hypothetical protein
VRWIEIGGIEILRMIYSAVRDNNWGTIEPEIIWEKIEEHGTGFQIEMNAKYKKNDIDFIAHYLISGTENRLVFEMNGEAKSTFMTNRAGFCVLHPIKECAGKICTVVHPDKTSETAVFPELISPIQPMKNISAMEWEPAKGITAKLQFSGDIFEMEDQRNWTDASYKTYCRPLSLPFPFEIKKGKKISQKIVLEIHGKSQNQTGPENFSFSIDKNKTYKLPEIGVGATSRAEKLENNEAEFLTQNFRLQTTGVADSNPRLTSPFHHLRAEIKLFENTWQKDLKRFVDEAEKLGTPLFLVLYFSQNFAKECAEFIFKAKLLSIRIGHFLIVSQNHLPDKTIFKTVFPKLKKTFPSTKIGTGVNAYFAELNRSNEICDEAEFISFAVCPQIHAFDNASLVENLEAQKYAVESAKNRFPGKPIYVSPITLKQRFNVVATSAEPPFPPGELPSQVDSRQNTIFAAQWLLGSIKYLAQSGAELLTYFETVGWRGFVQGNYEPPVPEKFQAKKGEFFPIFEAIKSLAGFSEFIPSSSSHPLIFDGLVLKSEKETKLFLFNFSAEDIEIEIEQQSNSKPLKSTIPGHNSLGKGNRIVLKPFECIVVR